ncbi:MAG: BON domain-containing protein [Phenylobacterium sp.]|uniref:BON domain-containing protein n=1 Tax=Phenylobacterium sp. TaxID=1871053 RepID=UPI0011FFF2FF|nr:BON domain-containing protein [Phenylobacterium sp.]TAJ69823.1 MAG: BON domain-containing protein [Phenylobacterium sp.]
MEDRLLKKLVDDELQYQPSVDAADIGVRVENGIVHLDGNVSTFAQKAAVENAVKRVRGVRGYVEDLVVRPHGDTYSDDAIAARVANLLEWDVTLPRDVIKVQVEGGTVTLSGEVPWAYQRTSAETGVRRLAGVRALINLITIKPRVEAVDIKRRIEEALERQAEVESDRITVTVDGGKVRLDGKVRAWFERDIIERAAWSAAGVLAVDDRVTVSL